MTSSGGRKPGYASVDVAYAMGEWGAYASAGYCRDFSRDDGRSAGGLPGGVVTQPDDRTVPLLPTRRYGA